MVAAPGARGSGEVALRAVEEGFVIGLRVSPSAKRTRLQGRYGERLKIQVSSPPEDNRANREVEAALAAWLEVPADYVHIHSGHKSRDKNVLVRGLSEGELRRRLTRLAG